MVGTQPKENSALTQERGIKHEEVWTLPRNGYNI